MTNRCERMQISTLVLCGCLALFLFTTACNQPTAPDTRAADEATVRDLDAQWSKTAGSHDVEGTVAYYADDASVLSPNSAIATGKSAIHAMWASFLTPDLSISWQASKVEVSRSSDLAYVMGTYTLGMKDPQGNPMTDHGKFVEVWKRQADSKWKVVADIFNSDMPLPAPPDKKK